MSTEFVHGAKNDLWGLLRRLRMKTEEVEDDHWIFSGGNLVEDKSFWEQIEEVISEMPSKGRDEDLCSFLKRQRGLSEPVKTMLLEYVEGFHAADSERVSVQSLTRAEKASEEDEGTKQFRLGKGYGAVVDWFQSEAERHGAEFKLRASVDKIFFLD